MLNQHLAEELSKKHQITLVTTQFADEKPHEICNHVDIFRVPVVGRHSPNAATLLSMLSFFPASLWQGYRLLRTRPFDLVHSLFAIPSAPSGYALAKAFRLPHVLSILGGDIYDPSKRLSPHRTVLLHGLVKKILSGSDEVIGMSSDIILRAMTYYALTRDITLIPHGIRRPLFVAKTRRDLGYDPNDILLVTVGRLVPRKAVHDLLYVLQALKQASVKLLIIGDGPERLKLEGLATSLGVSEQTLFMGNVDDESKFQLLNLADIYISSTHHEGFGLVFLEAMAAGLPIISYDNGGHVDFLSDGTTGYLVQLGDLQALIQCTQALSSDATRRQLMGQANKRLVENYYIHTCAAKYDAIYEAVMHKGRRNGCKIGA